MKYFSHDLSDVQSKNIGEGTTIWQFVVILKNAVIGSNCNICAHVLIENKVQIGNNVTIKSGVQVWDGLIIEDDVFIGPNVTFTNDLNPRSKNANFTLEKTIIKKAASIGANATILAGNEIGEHAFIGAGAVVTKNIAKNEIWIGNPAKHSGYITSDGVLLDLNLVSKLKGKQYVFINNELREND
jgi:UDP-2-acetamido-3-amino-2,3-dideoxy-glucuronate N-acetyltransferase